MTSSILQRYNPAVPRRWLLALAGVMWTSVGLLLCGRAVSWLLGSPSSTAIVIGAASILIAIPGYRFGFSKVVCKNILRLEQLPERVCVFAFTAWRGYILIVVMIALGVMLRNSQVPKDLLSLPYASMGAVLLLGSFRFYAHFLRTAHTISPSVRTGE